MSSLNYFLERIEQLSQSIQDLKFDAPGIFTNAIIKKPSIIQLLKDANYNEQLLYRIKTKESSNHSGTSDKVKQSQVNLESERVDGKSYYIDPDLQTTNEEEEMMEPAVKIPKLTNGVKRKSDTEINSSPTKVSKKIDSITDMNEIYRMLINTMNKIPNIEDDVEFINEVSNLKQTHDGLVEEIDGLEQMVEEQKRHLRSSNIDYRSSELDLDLTEQEVDIDQLIRQEEQELEELENQLRN